MPLALKRVRACSNLSDFQLILSGRRRRDGVGSEGRLDSSTPSRVSGRASRIIRANSPRRVAVELAQLVNPVERAKGFLELLQSLDADQFLDVVAEFALSLLAPQRLQGKPTLAALLPVKL